MSAHDGLLRGRRGDSSPQQESSYGSAQFPCGDVSVGIVSLRRTSGPLVVEVLAPSLVGAALPRVAGDARRTAAPGFGEIGSEEAYRLLGLLDRLRHLFGGRIVVHIIEPFSLTWIVRVVRHRPRRFPVFVIGSRKVVAGLDEAAVTDQIAALLHLVPSR